MRLIDADALRNEMFNSVFLHDTEMQKWDSGCWIRYKLFENCLEAAPTVDVERQKALAAFEVLDRLSAAYYGKQMFFMQDNGMVYDRYECHYTTLEKTIDRMAQILYKEEEDAKTDM